MSVVQSHQEANKNFENLIIRWISKTIKPNISTFNEIVSLLPGVYPSLVLNGLKQMAINDTSLRSIVETISLQNILVNNNAANTFHQITLPVPHPLDYDWRFTKETTKELLNRVVSIISKEEDIILLGTPSLFRLCVEESVHHKVFLLDNNETAINSFVGCAPLFQTLKCNLLDSPLPQLKGSIVVADPPWYPDHIKNFMWSAAQICQEDGYLLISIPPVGTRASIAQDRANLFSWAYQLGFNLLELKPLSLTYMSPIFELNALKAEGILAVSPEWRRGDLAIFYLYKQVDLPRPSLTNITADEWVEEIFDSVRIRIKFQKLSGFSDPSLLSIVPGDILSSVSIQDERRSLVDVWTSGNRIFYCKGTSILQQIILALREGKSSIESITQYLGRQLTTIEISMISTAVQQLNNLIKIEKNENTSFGEI